MIITIDGPAGTGKTTVAKLCAEELGYTYVDTGAMYRALTYGIMKQGINHDDKEAIATFLKNSSVTIKSRFGEKRYHLNDEDVTDKIRSREVTGLVSKIASYGIVREKLVALQREIAKGINIVIEGRDLGTVVFKDNADVKIYLDASPEVRAERRYKELKDKDPSNDTLTHASVLEEINRRDTYDASRDISPMRPADDATIIDTSKLTIDDVVNRIINLKEKVETKSLNT